ncbi:ribonuclease III [Anaerofustis stercorihominis]|uniref:ribonuclease III n=1 Tax=Anaerofustis stercorihominis TaxID=214853 RepID=UPI0039933457
MEIEKLEQKLGYEFKDKELIKVALTHSSKSNENKALQNNERLEFLGDAVLDLCVGAYLYKTLTNKKEGVLTKLRALIVCADSLFIASEKLELGEFIMLGKGEMHSGGKYKKNIIADCFEAVLGAIYLDSDYEKVSTIALTLLSDVIKKAISGNLTYDYKTLLQEYIHSKNIKDFSYELVQIKGPEHDQIFTSKVILNNKDMGHGEGKNKKESEQHAALNTLKKLKLI